jgi:LacI family transcriptional regulator
MTSEDATDGSRRGPGATTKVATLSDVARLAGVSMATASKALNGRAQVRAETRARVQEAADRLSFFPNAVARSLLEGRTGTVGLITSDLEGRFSIPILMGVEDALGADRTSVFLCDARGDAIREQHHLRALLSRRVDGVIVVGARPDPRRPLALDVPVPVVYAYAPSQDPRDTSVVSDNVGGGRLAIEHLLTTGRKRIAHITGDPSYSAATERADGARQALFDAGLELAGPGVLVGAWNEGWGRGATRMLLDQAPDLDAIFAGSDHIARGVLDALHEAGRRVPEDIAVIGFDNWEIMVEHARPPLSSVDINLEQLGRTAAMLLNEAITGNARPGVHSLPCRLVARGSTLLLT